MYADDEITAVEMLPRNIDRRIDARRARIAERRKITRATLTRPFDQMKDGSDDDPDHAAAGTLPWGSEWAIAHAVVYPHGPTRRAPSFAAHAC
jgi:hypothetical protein